MKWNKDKYAKLIEEYAKQLIKWKYKIAMDLVNNQKNPLGFSVNSIDDNIRIEINIYKRK